jgi:hypothetical protein
MCVSRTLDSQIRPTAHSLHWEARAVSQLGVVRSNGSDLAAVVSLFISRSNGDAISVTARPGFVLHIPGILQLVFRMFRAP